MNLAALVASFATAASYSVIRRARGATVRGRVQDPTEITVTITASVSPAKGADIEYLRQGRQVQAAVQIFTQTQLMIGGPGATYEADRITVNGDIWEVAHVEAWTDPRSRAVIYRCLATNIL